VILKSPQIERGECRRLNCGGIGRALAIFFGATDKREWSGRVCSKPSEVAAELNDSALGRLALAEAGARQD
jgi:hypothetical protein